MSQFSALPSPDGLILSCPSARDVDYFPFSGEKVGPSGCSLTSHMVPGNTLPALPEEVPGHLLYNVPQESQQCSLPALSWRKQGKISKGEGTDRLLGHLFHVCRNCGTCFHRCFSLVTNTFVSGRLLAVLMATFHQASR